ncbi:hypothetical protein JT366_08480 [Sphingomonas paucimobilis]|uniref:hypothetical protein n=1 Tax=Sphingomonas paucimobilis TaxID=13689 RepID=UPI001963335B|nr:hypothetical protein [Sphingomonas paucimobilis]QRY97240.1 hypothetical protein JT366_08480 [Sphingomonas paucimobilis]
MRRTPAAKTRAELAAEKIARADGDRAEAEARATLSAQVSDPATGLPWARSAIADLARVTNDRDNANATLIQQVRTMLDGIGNVGIQQAFEAVINRLGVIEGRYSVSMDVNGNLFGYQLIGGATGPAAFNLINTNLKLGTGKVVFDDGKMMMVQGVGFGVSETCSNGSAPRWRSTSAAAPMRSPSKRRTVPSIWAARFP